MTASRFSMMAILLLAACAGGKTGGRSDVAAWRHRDGSAVTALELAQSQAACRQTVAVAEDRRPAPFVAENPAYHPGGIGLETTSPPGGFGYSSALPNVPSAPPGDTGLIEACLDSKGIVRAP